MTMGLPTQSSDNDLVNASISIGAGRKSVLCVRVQLRTKHPVHELGEVLTSVEQREEAWWSPHLWCGDQRANKNWIGSWGIVLDLDYIDEHGTHTAQPNSSEAAFYALLPRYLCSAAHRTPRGWRLIFLFTRLIDAPSAFDELALAIAAHVGRVLAEGGIAAWDADDQHAASAGYEVDQPLVKDKARIFFGPTAIVDGRERNAEVLILNAQPFDAEKFIEFLAPVEYADADRKSASGRSSNSHSGRTVADRALRLAADADLFHDSNQTAYATLTQDGHRETWALRGRRFKNWLQRRFYDESGTVLGSKAVEDALGVLEGKALFAGPQREVHVRLAQEGDAIYLDLGNPSWTVLRIDPNGWGICGDPPVVFRRPGGLLEIPMPTPGGSISELRQFINVADEDDWTLIKVALLAVLRPGRPCPILIFNGEQGSAKSTAQRVIRRLVDPNKAELRSCPRSEHDLVIAASNSWIVALDNLSGVSPWLSDSFCRLATGGGFGTRALFTNSEEQLFDDMRPIMLNGIEDLATRGDLLDRSIVFQLPVIKDLHRLDEETFWQRFEAARPRILGALLTALSAALAKLPAIPRTNLPRMADFAMIATAGEAALECSAGAFTRAYDAKRSAVHDVAIDASIIAQGLITLVDEEEGEWQGTATELLGELEKITVLGRMHSKDWPKSASALSGKVRRLAPSLRGVGIEVEFTQDSGGGSRKHIHLVSKERGFGADAS